MSTEEKLDQEKTYTPPPIIGYRQLSQTEVDQMNAVKMEAELVRDLVQRIKDIPSADPRWVQIAEDHLQQGFMCLVRAIAQPTGY
jgi:hypothetical protein